jgi:hypothetical protein
LLLFFDHKVAPGGILPPKIISQNLIRHPSAIRRRPMGKASRVGRQSKERSRNQTRRRFGSGLLDRRMAFFRDLQGNITESMEG